MTKNKAQKKSFRVRSYVFHAVVEKDPFGPAKPAWRAYIPQLEQEGAASWGLTPHEALHNLQVITRLVVEDMLTAKKHPPALQTTRKLLIAVTV